MKIRRFIALLISAAVLIPAQNLPEKSDVIDILIRVNDYWQNSNPQPGSAFWHHAAYHTGNMEAWSVTGLSRFLDYSMQWGVANEWKGAKSDNKAAWRYTYGESDDYVLFGDWQICFQTYIDLYNIKNDPQMTARALEVMEYQTSTANDDYWWWADGLYMVMPVMTKLYKLTGDEIYLDKLHEYFSYAKSIMYDDETGLFYRDAKYVYPQHTSYNGKKDFWARGDGWVFAGLAKVLQDLPTSSPYREAFETVFTKMAATLADAQQPGGYWTRSLLDPEHAPGYETSGTAFFTYGFLWGINNGILDKDTYQPVVLAAWTYLSETALNSSGRVGYVQPIGENASPGQVVGEQSTANFGVGAFLLACAEMARFAPGTMPFFIRTVSSSDENSITVRFNRKVAETSASAIENYSSDQFSVTSVTITADSSSVILSCTDIPAGKHELDVGNITSSSGDTLQNIGPYPFIVTGNIIVTAGSFEPGSGNVPANTLDFNPDTRWSAEGSGQWLLFDLNDIKQVSSVDISYYLGNERINYLTIEVSADGSSFEEVFNGQSSGTSSEPENYPFEPQEARFIRITGNGNSENAWNSITEVHINSVAITDVRYVTREKFTTADQRPFLPEEGVVDLKGRAVTNGILPHHTTGPGVFTTGVSSGMYLIRNEPDRATARRISVR